MSQRVLSPQTASVNGWTLYEPLAPSKPQDASCRSPANACRGRALDPSWNQSSSLKKNAPSRRSSPGARCRTSQNRAALLGPRQVFSYVYVAAEYPTLFFGQALLNKPRLPHVQTSRRVTCNILETPGHFMKWRGYASLDVSSIGLSSTWVVMSDGPIVVLGHLEHKTGSPKC